MSRPLKDSGKSGEMKCVRAGSRKRETRALLMNSCAIAVAARMSQVEWDSSMIGGSRLPPPTRTVFAVSVKNPVCPWLPEVEEIHDFSITRRHGSFRGGEFYLDALRFAQSQWIVGKPAQAILQLNKAWMADLEGDDPVLENHPSPYQALVWILERASSGECGYLGNPVRHFQHLASRMCGPRAEIRAWRAWLCFHLAEKHLASGEYPRDGVQIAREGLWIPSFQQARTEVFGSLSDLTWLFGKQDFEKP